MVDYIKASMHVKHKKIIFYAIIVTDFDDNLWVSDSTAINTGKNVYSRHSGV